MPLDTHFVRVRNRNNAAITDSFCLCCQTFVGASPSLAVLKLMEGAHACDEIRKHRDRGSAAAGKKKKTTRPNNKKNADQDRRLQIRGDDSEWT